MKNHILILAITLSSSVIFAEDIPQERDLFFDDDSTLIQLEEPTPVIAKEVALFESFMEVFLEGLKTKDSLLVQSCFSSDITFTSDDGTIEANNRKEFFDFLISQKGELNEVYDYLALLSNGFELNSTENSTTYSNLHCRASLFDATVKITGNGVNFRRAPSLNSDVVCKLQSDVYSGRLYNNGLIIEDEQNQVQWLPIQLFHPTMGTVKGYVSNNFATVTEVTSVPLLNVEFKNGQWKIKSISPRTTTLASLNSGP